MDMNCFSVRNRIRCEAVNGFNHRLDSWSSSDWMTAVVGELGEAANLVKKLNRVRDGIPGNTEDAVALRAKLAHELADTYIYLDLLCQSLGVSLADSVLEKFEISSKKIGYVEHGCEWCNQVGTNCHCGAR
jgi:NTP pyrophosphatase (non-canonical NTP hydrolase)